MDILFLLIPLSAVLVLAIIALFGWAVQAGQFDDLEREGGRMLQDDPESFDARQGPEREGTEQSQGLVGGTPAECTKGDPA